MPEGFTAYRKNLDRYFAHMDRAARRSLDVRSNQILLGANAKVGVDTGRLKSSNRRRVTRPVSGGHKAEVVSGWRESYAPHHHFPGITRSWPGNRYLQVPFRQHAPKVITDLQVAHRAFRPGPLKP